MSIEINNPKTTIDKVDAASNLVAQMYLAYRIKDEKQFNYAYKMASDLLFDVMRKLDEMNIDETELPGIDVISKERLRQINKEGWTSDHDDKHVNNELVRAAITYLCLNNLEMTENEDGEDLITSGYWPFDLKWLKPTPDNRVIELAKAGALIAAEIDRIIRQKNKI